MTRLEIRVSEADKELFETASTLKGFKSLSEFLRVTLTSESREIISQEKKTLASQQDKDIFFRALMEVESPVNDALKSAVKDHDQRSDTSIS